MPVAREAVNVRVTPPVRTSGRTAHSRPGAHMGELCPPRRNPVLPAVPDHLARLQGPGPVRDLRGTQGPELHDHRDDRVGRRLRPGCGVPALCAGEPAQPRDLGWRRGVLDPGLPERPKGPTVQVPLLTRAGEVT